MAQHIGRQPAAPWTSSRRSFLAASAGFAGLGLAGLAGCGGDDSSSGSEGASGNDSSGSSAAGTTAGSAAPGTTAIHGMSHYIATVTSLESGRRGFKWAIDQLGGSFDSESYDGDQQKLMSQSQLFGSLGINGTSSYVVSDAVVRPYVEQLAASGIAYVNNGNRVPWLSPLLPTFKGHYVANLNGSFAEDGYVVGKILLERGGGAGKAIRLKGAPGAVDDARTFGFDLALKEFPDVEVVAESVTNWDRAKAQEEAQALLSAHPDVKFIIGYNDSIALGALAAARALNLGDFVVSGVDGDPEFLTEMVNDERVVATAAARIDFVGALAATLIFDYLNGVTLNPLECFLDTDSVVLDSPGAAQAMFDLIGEDDDPLPYDATKMSRFLQGENWEYPHRVRVGNPSSFDWGDKPGVVPTAKPADAEWPAEYDDALNGGELERLNSDYETHINDIYGSVRSAGSFKGQGVFGAFDALGIT